MKVSLIIIGKTEEKYLVEGIEKYLSRIKHYVPFSVEEISALKKTKNLPVSEIKRLEGKKILEKVDQADKVILLDEKGKTYSSESFADYVDNILINSGHRVVFIIGGAYGFSEELYQRSNGKIALSEMTFSHQMVRLIFVEQFYRAMTIIRGEPYHHR